MHRLLLLALAALTLAGCNPPAPAESANANYWDVDTDTHPPRTDIRLNVFRQHPRLVFRPESNKGLGRSFEDVRRLYRTDPTFKAIFDKALAVEPGKHHPAAEAVCWIVSGDDRYAESAVRTMVEGKLRRSGEPYYTNIWSWALAMDWLHGHRALTPEARAVILPKIRERLETELDDLDGTGLAYWHGTTQATNGVMIAALAFGDLPGWEPLLQRATAHYIETLRAIEFSEGWPEGASYWIYNRAGPMGLAADCFITATGTDTLAGHDIRRALANLGYWSLYSYAPNGRFEPYGDSSGSLHLGDTGWWVLSVDHYAKLSRDPGLAAGADYLRNRSPNPYGRRSYHWNVAMTYDPSARPGEGYDPAEPERWMRRHLPQAKLFGRDSMGVAFFRGRWGDPDELYVTFKAGDLLAHHDHYDTGHFSIQRGGDLAPRTGFYGDYFGQHRLGYFVQTVSKNSLLVMAPGEESAFLRWKKGAPIRSLSGGQRVIRPTSFYVLGMKHFKEQLNAGPHLERATITAFESRPRGFDYIAADITAAYNSTRFATPGNPAKVSLVTRQLLYLRPEEAVVVYDRVETTDAGFLPKFLLHSNSKPASESESLILGQTDNGILDTDGRTLAAEHDRGRLTQRILLPEHMRAVKIGGPNFAFYAELDGDPSDGFDGENLIEGAFKRSRARPIDQWRVEVEPTVPDTSTRFCNVLLPRLKTDGRPLPKVALLDAGDTAHAVRVGATVAVFAHDAKPLTSIRLDLTLGGRCIVLDAEPNATYRAAGRQVTASEEGVLTLEDTPAGLVSIEKAGK